MATAFTPTPAAEPFGPTFPWPSTETMDAGIRKARHAFNDTRFALEDYATETALRVRRHPLAAISVTAAAGLGAGFLIGFAAAWLARPRA